MCRSIGNPKELEKLARKICKKLKIEYLDAPCIIVEMIEEYLGLPKRGCVI
jgi:hypothetical protein